METKQIKSFKDFSQPRSQGLRDPGNEVGF